MTKTHPPDISSTLISWTDIAASIALRTSETVNVLMILPCTVTCQPMKRSLFFFPTARSRIYCWLYIPKFPVSTWHLCEHLFLFFSPQSRGYHMQRIHTYTHYALKMKSKLFWRSSSMHYFLSFFQACVRSCVHVAPSSTTLKVVFLLSLLDEPRLRESQVHYKAFFYDSFLHFRFCYLAK